MKYQILFSRKNKKNITNLWSAKSAHSVVSVKESTFRKKKKIHNFACSLAAGLKAWTGIILCWYQHIFEETCSLCIVVQNCS